MKKFNYTLPIICIFLFGLTACGSTNDYRTPSIETTEKFRINTIAVHLIEKVSSDITYHTEEELTSKISTNIKANLEKNGLLSIDEKMNSIDISLTYIRRFVGDETPFPSDALGFPNFNYSITIYDGERVLTIITRSNLIYKGGFSEGIKVMAAQLNEKSDELPFIEAASNTIINAIKQLKK